MKIALTILLAAATAFAQEFYSNEFIFGFDCGTKKANDVNSAETEPSTETCCLDEEREKSLCDDFDCGSKVANDYPALSGERHETNCCVSPTCGNPLYQCPDGQMFNQTVRYDAESSDSNCCQPFVADCGHKTSAKAVKVGSSYYDIFECAEGTTLNTTALASTPPDQATCCQPFVPTCNFNSGSILAPEPYPCPEGKKLMPQSSESSESACCEDFTSNCAEVDTDGNIFQCPAGKVMKSNARELEKPSEDTCCEALSCGSAVPITCGNAGIEGCSGPNMVFDESKKNLQISPNIFSGVCCIREEILYSAGSKLHAGVAFAVAATALFLL